MKGFKSNIEQDTLDNLNFRKVLYTGKHSQLVLMSLRPNEEIGLETHAENDQFLRFEGGEGTGPDGHSHRRAFEVDTWTWSIFHDQLTLQWINPSLKPGQYPSPVNVKPWTRIGDAPAVLTPQTAPTTPN